VVIACAGRSPKWEDPRTPPHLWPVDGKPLLHRTVEQVSAVTTNIHITSGDDQRYKIPGTHHHVRSPDEPSEYASTRDLWSPVSRTILALGDVYWSDAAIGRVLACGDRDYRVFGRFGPSRITGTPYGEIFAASFWPAQHEALDRHLDIVHRTRAAGTVTRPPGWMLLRSWQGTPLGKHRVRKPWFVELPADETDDLDRDDDLRRHPVFRRGSGAGG
jgi:hypothetical protein